VVAVLRVVAVVDGLVCAGIVLLALGALARERSATLGVLRTVGAGGRSLTATLTGAAVAHVVPAVAGAYALERLVLAPALSGLVARYGALPLVPSTRDVVGVVAAATVVALGTGAATAARASRRPVAATLREL
jgi:ABC-type lipoprotein release transport system permease subunit